jgi:uncharacterized membrane-anchored protein YjiN (DUF445 family)
VRAGLEASLVGGLADWFAVTALFRHPLGVPIPHTAVIRARKDQFADTLGSFVQENFLNPDVISARLRGAEAVSRAARWISDRSNASRVAEHLATAAVGLADTLRDDDVRRLMEEETQRAVAALPLAPLAGRTLRLLTAQGRHRELLDAGLRASERFLQHHREDLRARFAEQSPWWLPEPIDDRIFDRLFDGVCGVLAQVNADEGHELRREFERALDDLAARLEHAPEAAARAEQLKRELLTQQELRAWSSALWSEVKAILRRQAAEPESELRVRLTDALVASGQRLTRDPALAAKAEQLLESAVRYGAGQFHHELGELVSGTVARWDAEETSRKLELLLGRDLQFIRINGTVVGGVAGVIIYAVAQALG